MVEPIARDTTSTPPADHPYFVSTIKPYCLNMPHLYLPMEFARSNGLVTEEKREMILRDDKERSWSVDVGREGHQFSLRRGWQAFRRANCLKVGDAYKFELIKTGKTPIAKFHCNLFSAEKREMILRDDKERSWPVVLGRMGHHVGLLRGWQAFQMAKGLKEGDAYKFELIKNGKKPIAKFYCKCRFSSIILAVLKAKTCVFLAHIAMGANGNFSRSLFWRRRLKEAVAGMF
nr:B3 domain-containing protein REM10-like [Ipomoea batatas]